MKTYISDLIPKIQRFSKKLDDLTLLTNQHWVVIDDISNAKNVYIFRQNNQLLISRNGKVEKASWEYLGSNSILIDRGDESYLFKHGFFDENVLALKIDGKNEYAFLVNETRYDGELNSIDTVLQFLQIKYFDTNGPFKFEGGAVPIKITSFDKEIIESDEFSIPNYSIVNIEDVSELFDRFKQTSVLFEDGIKGYTFRGYSSKTNYIIKDNTIIYYDSENAAIKGLYSACRYDHLRERGRYSIIQ